MHLAMTVTDQIMRNSERSQSLRPSVAIEILADQQGSREIKIPNRVFQEN